jgi:hypothetical protein
MKQVTISRQNDGSAKLTEWKDREKPTSEELTPIGAEICIYTTMPHDFCDAIRNLKKDEVSAILSGYLP